MRTQDKLECEALWPFAVALYGQPGVAERCLALQDQRGVDVNLLLAAAWLAARGCSWSAEEVFACAGRWREWRRRCLEPVRGARRCLRPVDAALYRQAKALELALERFQLEGLEAELACVPGRGVPDLSERLRANLTAVLSRHDVPGREVEVCAAVLGAGIRALGLQPGR